MKLALIAGNRSLPLVFLQSALKNPEVEVVSVCFKGETSPAVAKLAHKSYWINVGQMQRLIDILKKESISRCVMVGQISPCRIFHPHAWDSLMQSIVKGVDYRAHSIFSAFITYLETEGFEFLDSTLYMKEILAAEGNLNDVVVSDRLAQDIEFGRKLISRYVELDVGQTIVVKKKAPIALEALEGTDNTIKRGYRIAGNGCTVLKFSKKDQDLRFDVPVVGLKTLRLLKRIRAAALVLEAQRTLILHKEQFLPAARRAGIAVIGQKRI